MPDRRLLVATGNAGKLREYQHLLAPAHLELVAHDTRVEESGATYEANATLKAEAAAAETGLPALGDDSGLEVDVLDGFPGLFSARQGATQEERTRVLLTRLAGHDRPWRARFVCVIALAVAGRPTSVFRGERAGEIVPEWRGEAGFGYDPVFLIPEAGATFGEMPPAEKQRWSHRAEAAKALLASGLLADLG